MAATADSACPGSKGGDRAEEEWSNPRWNNHGEEQGNTRWNNTRWNNHGEEQGNPGGDYFPLCRLARRARISAFFLAAPLPCSPVM